MLRPPPRKNPSCRCASGARGGPVVWSERCIVGRRGTMRPGGCVERKTLRGVKGEIEWNLTLTKPYETKIGSSCSAQIFEKILIVIHSVKDIDDRPRSSFELQPELFLILSHLKARHKQVKARHKQYELWTTWLDTQYDALISDSLKSYVKLLKCI